MKRKQYHQIFCACRGFDRGEFQNIFIDNHQITSLFKNRHLRGLKFTGSHQVGKLLAESSGESMIKATFELGGNDAFIVLNDANIDKAVEAAYKSRMLCNGQAAVNAKRFIIQDEVYDEFKDKLLNYIEKHTVVGDPFDLRTTLGPIGMKKGLIQLRQQVQHAVKNAGAQIIYGDLNFEMR